MIYTVVAIKDRALDAFQGIFNVRAEGEAIRAFQDAINKNENPMHMHPEDYDLYVLGTYDDNTGTITPATPKQIAIGKQLSYRLNEMITVKDRSRT